MTGTEAERTLELVATAERAVVRLLLAMGEPVPHVGAASYYAVCTAAKLDAVVGRAVERLLEAKRDRLTASPASAIMHGGSDEGRHATGQR